MQKFCEKVSLQISDKKEMATIPIFVKNLTL